MEGQNQTTQQQEWLSSLESPYPQLPDEEWQPRMGHEVKHSRRNRQQLNIPHLCYWRHSAGRNSWKFTRWRSRGLPAPLLWKAIQDIHSQTDLSSKSISLRALHSFNFDQQPDMTSNKVALVKVRKNIVAAFRNKKEISVFCFQIRPLIKNDLFQFANRSRRCKILD